MIDDPGFSPPCLVEERPCARGGAECSSPASISRFCGYRIESIVAIFAFLKVVAIYRYIVSFGSKEFPEENIKVSHLTVNLHHGEAALGTSVALWRGTKSRGGSFRFLNQEELLLMSDRLRRLALRGGEGTSLVCLLGCGSLQEPEIVKHCEKVKM